MDFIDLRKKVIKKYFGRMNDRQFEAVFLAADFHFAPP